MRLRGSLLAAGFHHNYPLPLCKHPHLNRALRLSGSSLRPAYPGFCKEDTHKTALRFKALDNRAEQGAQHERMQNSQRAKTAAHPSSSSPL